MNKYKVGDVVQLASGGPRMTVISKGEHPGTAWCHWFAADGLVKGHAFPEDALVKADAGEPSGRA